MNPLRIYLYDDGLVRFASNKYTNESSKVHDVFTHLTNYSINKKSASYLSNEEAQEAQGHKWTLKTLWRHFDAEGIDHSVIWEKIKDLMIKTVISAESSMVNLFQNNVASRYSCFELFGFDILLDSRLKPWLIEVNISPSLHSSSSLDLDVKSPLATEVFNMARYHIPNRLRVKDQVDIAEKMGYGNITNLCFDRRLYIKEISKAEKSKQESYLAVAASSDSSLPPLGLLDHLTPDDCRQLVLSEDELATSQRFTRIFPTENTHKYFKFLEKPRYYNLLLSAWEQRYGGINREAGRSVLEQLCIAKHHLKVPANVYVKKTALGQQTIDISGLEAPRDVPTNGGGDKAATNGSHGSDSSQKSENSQPECEDGVREVIVNGSDDTDPDSNSQHDLKVGLNPENKVSVHMNGNKSESVENLKKDESEENGNIIVEKLGKSEAACPCPVLETASSVNNLSVGVL
jgi:hypothetical protein